MPTYEYACKSCGEHLEVVQSFKDDPLTVCSACGGPVRRVFSPIGIAFKGSGFYRNDSRTAKGSRSGRSQPDSSDTTTTTPTPTTSKEGAKATEGSSKPAGSSSAGTSTEKNAAAS